MTQIFNQKTVNFNGVQFFQVSRSYLYLPSGLATKSGSGLKMTQREKGAN